MEPFFCFSVKYRSKLNIYQYAHLEFNFQMSESLTFGMGSHPDVTLKWNPKNLEIKTRSVEKNLEPLVMQVTTLVSSKSPQKKKGKSKRAHVLVAAVERATANFVEKGELIALENPDIKLEMLSAVDEVRSTGTAMSGAAKEFANDPCSSVKRGNMVRASRNLLSAVTRLLILADMIDVHLLLKKLRRVEDDLEYLKSVSSQAELIEGMDRFGKSSADLMTQAAKRQYELKVSCTEQKPSSPTVFSRRKNNKCL